MLICCENHVPTVALSGQTKAGLWIEITSFCVKCVISFLPGATSSVKMDVDYSIVFIDIFFYFFNEVTLI